MTSETKQEFLNDIEKTEGKKWMQYYKNSVSDVLKIDNDKFMLFDKPTIKTQFCFSYGQNGLSTEDDENRASDMAQHAQNSEKYFLNENLEDINKKLALVEAYVNNPENMGSYLEKKYQNIFSYSYNRYTFKKPYLFYQCYNIDKKVYYRFMDDYEKQEYLAIEQNKKYLIKELSLNEMKQILNILQTEKTKFEKRLQTYLKRYGLSKIHSWTFLSD